MGWAGGAGDLGEACIESVMVFGLGGFEDLPWTLDWKPPGCA